MKHTALSACYDNLIGVDYDRWLRYILQVLEVGAAAGRKRRSSICLRQRARWLFASPVLAWM